MKIKIGFHLASRILRRRGQLGYLFPMLEEKKRIQCFFDLAKVGEREDVDPLRTIGKDKCESKEIRNHAILAHNAIVERLRREEYCKPCRESGMNAS